MSDSVPFRDESDGRGTFKRTYWPKGDAVEKRREIRRAMEGELARKDKKVSLSDKKKMLDEKWGNYCERQRSLDEINRSVRDG